MYRLKIGTVPLPKIYVCETAKDRDDARHHGVPYVVKPRGWDDEKLVKAVLFRYLQRKFPAIRWTELLHMRPPELKVHVPDRHVSSEHRENPGFDTCGASDDAMDISDDYRMTGGGLAEDDLVEDVPVFHVHKLDDVIGETLDHYVDIEQLQSLKLLPVFMDDIASAVKQNLLNTSWMDGWNKKLGYNAGSWKAGEQAPNLIILDTSSSIPSGVASTMVSLIDTLRHQANADLIITTGRSVFFPAHSELPDPDKLSYLVGGCNECRQFYKILRDNILGRHWGNVIVFGDNDAPEAERFRRDRGTWLKDSELQSTRIDRIMAFHTYGKRMPGYGLWAEKCSPNAQIVYNDEWVEHMDQRRRW